MGEMKGNKESKEERYKRFDKVKVILRKVRVFFAQLEVGDTDSHPSALRHALPFGKHSQQLRRCV